MTPLNNNEFNPFLVFGYLDKEHFCNREKETANTISLNQSKINITLFALRRIDKTGLIHHIFNIMGTNKKIVCIYIDILASQNLKDFTSTMYVKDVKKYWSKTNKSISSTVRYLPLPKGNS